MHARNPIVVHRDLKSLNVVLGAHFAKYRSDLFRLRADQLRHGGFEVKICDFGLTRAMESSHLTITQNKTGGSPRYMAPEIYSGLGNRMSEKVDVYAMGCVLYEIFGGGFPHGECRNMREIALKLLAHRKGLTFAHPERVPVMVVNLVDKLVNFDANRRGTAAEALQSLKIAEGADPQRAIR